MKMRRVLLISFTAGLAVLPWALPARAADAAASPASQASAPWRPATTVGGSGDGVARCDALATVQARVACHRRLAIESNGPKRP